MTTSDDTFLTLIFALAISAIEKALPSLSSLLNPNKKETAAYLRMASLSRLSCPSVVMLLLVLLLLPLRLDTTRSMMY